MNNIQIKFTSVDFSNASVFYVSNLFQIMYSHSVIFLELSIPQWGKSMLLLIIMLV